MLQSRVKDFDAQVNDITIGPRKDLDANQVISLSGFDMQATDNILASLARDFYAADAYFTECLSGATPRTVLSAKDSLDETFYRVNTQLNNLTTGIKGKITEGSVHAELILERILSFHDLCLYTKNIADDTFRKLITAESVSTSLDNLQTLWTQGEDNLKRLEREPFSAQSKLERYKATVSSQFGSLASVTSHKGFCGLDSNDAHNKELPVGDAINFKPHTEDFLNTLAIPTQCQIFATCPTRCVEGCSLSEETSYYRYSAPCNGPAVQPDLPFYCQYSEAYNGPAVQPKWSSTSQYSTTSNGLASQPLISHTWFGQLPRIPRNGAADATNFNRGFHTCEMSIDSTSHPATVSTHNCELQQPAQCPVIPPSSPVFHQEEASVNSNSNDFVEFVKKKTLTRSPFGPVNNESDCSLEPEDVDLNVLLKMYSKNPRKTAIEMNSTSMDSSSVHRYVAEMKLRSSCILFQDLHPPFKFEDFQKMQAQQLHGLVEESLLRRNCLFCDHDHNYYPSTCHCKIHGCGCAQGTLLHDAYKCSVYSKSIVVASNNTVTTLSSAIAEMSCPAHRSAPLVIITCLVASTSFITCAFLIYGAVNFMCTLFFLSQLVISGEPMTCLMNIAAILPRQPKFVPISVEGIG